jgi:cytochrome b
MTRVWDPLVRIFHWSLVASFAVAWFTPRSAADIHQWAGYVAGGLVLMRLLWGVLGTPYARFSQFVRHPKSVVQYLLAIIGGHEARYIGHNPAGGMMVLALVSLMVVTSFTGWMMTTDAYFGEDWVQILHSLSAHGLLVLVFIHVGGVVLASVRHRENLVRAMITGQKRKAGAEDIS